jgi:Fur family peroxide stress response transcriptional regulator
MNLSRTEILASFQKHHIRCTPQRYAVMEYLARRQNHPTAEEVYTAINRANPRASLATVYKCLHGLSKAGLVRPVSLQGEAVRYESNMQQHHHFVCDRCGRVEDVEWFEVPHAARTRAANSGTVHRYDVILRGLCAKCS